MRDDLDNRLLALLQSNAQMTTLELGEALGLSASQIGRRKQRLEADGLISHYAAHLNASALGLSVQAFVHVHLRDHTPQNASSFGRMIALRPEVTSAWTLTGDADFLLRVFCTDLAELNMLIHDVLLRHDAVARVHSQIVLDQLKQDGPLPTP